MSTTNTSWENSIWEWATNEFPRQHSDKFERLIEVVRNLIESERAKERERILAAIENAPAEAQTTGWDAYEGDFIRALLSPKDTGKE